MSTRNLNSKSIKKEFQALFEQSPEERIEHRAQILSYIFLSEAEKAMERKGWNKKQLADEIGTSASYLTQLFRGDRLLNFKTIAKIEHAFSLEYQISETANNASTKEYSRFFVTQDEVNLNTSKVNSQDKDKWTYRSYSGCTVHELRAA
jgi:transcriptional regulator with XRE-family HTH domain